MKCKKKHYEISLVCQRFGNCTRDGRIHSAVINGHTIEWYDYPIEMEIDMQTEETCSVCGGEGEIISLFGETSTCKPCKGAGVIFTKTKGTISLSVRDNSKIESQNFNPDVDKTVIRNCESGGIWLTGNPKWAQEIVEEYFEGQVDYELLTQNEYYSQYGNYKWLRPETVIH